MSARTCIVSECDRAYYGRGFCQAHLQRVYVHGDPRADVPLGRMLDGSSNPRWTDQPSYSGAHRRVTATRGPASAHACSTCPSQAAQWSYDHADTAELTDERGYPYSADPAHYRPACVKAYRWRTYTLRHEGRVPTYWDPAPSWLVEALKAAGVTW